MKRYTRTSDRNSCLDETAAVADMGIGMSRKWVSRGAQ